MSIEPRSTDKTNPLSDREWFSLAAERDYIAWQLGEMHNQLKVRSPMAAAVDKATGYEDTLALDAYALMARCDEINAILAADSSAREVSE